ncbi:MAG: hypothetical protein ACLQPH_00765 [Acidimicrobiales bacterium]
MNAWGASTYGEPCRECGFGWSIPTDEAVSMVAGLPGTYRSTLAGATGRERIPGLDWSVGAYVCHVGDNLRIWAERLMGVVAGERPEVGAYDEAALAAARRYEQIPLGSSLWSLDRSVDDWRDAVGWSRRAGTVLVHPDRGPLTLAEVVTSTTHDAFHHGWDISRILGHPAR